MRAEEMLPDESNRAAFGGVSVRKGSVGAFIHNARAWCNEATSTADRVLVERDMAELLPALQALGLFDIMAVRDPKLAAWIVERATEGHAPLDAGGYGATGNTTALAVAAP